MRRRIVYLMLIFSVAATGLYINLYGICCGAKYKQAGSGHGTMTVSAGGLRGHIYDCSVSSLNNTESVIRAIVKPSASSWDMLEGHVLYPENYKEVFKNGRAFVCEVDTENIPSPDIHTFTLACRDESSPLAIHLLGYLRDGHGVCGLERAYDETLGNYSKINSVTYSVDGLGGVVAGMSKKLQSGVVSHGVVTTLDAELQRICEEALADAGCAAAVILETGSGNIRASASSPTYSVNTLAQALESADSPMLNRALSAYSVGSVFKLVIAAAALENGIEDFEYECKGYTEVGGQVFRCHFANGHGVQNMEAAMVNSCNPYFIALGQKLDNREIIAMAKTFGFGSEIFLARDIYSAAGRLQTADELKLPAEKANMCFGQGVLTATPLQVAAMTNAIASNGTVAAPRLITGTTVDGSVIRIESGASEIRVISPETAYALHRMMAATVQYNEDESPARPSNTTAAGKTSTAQTGQYDENGTEYCHAWITGYFPLVDPKYTVTVFVENGGYGNKSAAPVFKEIAEKIARLKGLTE